MNSWEPGPSHGLTRENLVATLPVALQKDPSAVALAEAMAELLARRPDEIEQLRIYPVIDRLNEQLLDILAYDFKVDWWDADYSLEEKRQTLKDSWRVHKLLGTKAAVETAIRDIYPNTNVQEWFEYEGGKPYHFKLYIDLTDTFGDETRPWRVLERVNFYKSLRSHMDEIVFTMTTKPATLRVGGGVDSLISMGVPAAGDVFDFQRSVFVGGYFGADTSIGAPGGQETFDLRQTILAGGKFSGRTRVPIPEDTAQPQAPTAVHTGGTFSSDAAVPVPENSAHLPATTILRTGGVCTIISNLSKGD